MAGVCSLLLQTATDAQGGEERRTDRQSHACTTYTEETGRAKHKDVHRSRPEKTIEDRRD